MFSKLTFNIYLKLGLTSDRFAMFLRTLVGISDMRLFCSVYYFIHSERVVPFNLLLDSQYAASSLLFEQTESSGWCWFVVKK